MTPEDVEEFSDAIRAVGRAITSAEAITYDANGELVDSLTESVVGVTGGLRKIAEAIERLAAAIETATEKAAVKVEEVADAIRARDFNRDAGGK